MTAAPAPYSTVAVLSGGLDSTVLAYLMAAQLAPGDRLLCLSVNYGQRHVKELGFAYRTTERLGCAHRVVEVDLAAVAPSALTTADWAVPEGHYADDTMRQTVVPNRNAVLANLAVAAAVGAGAQRVALGVHAGDHPIYPDCRPGFIDALNQLAAVATAGHAPPGFHVTAPFVHLGKHHIVALGERLGVPWADTWSCYQGGRLHCGRCGTCVERREAFELAGVRDRTGYEVA